jgi:hypothetical protein
MWIPSRIKAFFLALYRTVRASMERVTSEDKNYQRIQLTDSDYGLYLKFPSLKFQLRCSEGESSSVDLSLDEARALFASIAAACERQDMIKVKIGYLSWTTDARLNPKRPDHVVVKFSGPLGLGIIGLSRRRVVSACEEFSSIFGQVSMSPGGVSFDD